MLMGVSPSLRTLISQGFLSIVLLSDCLCPRTSYNSCRLKSLNQLLALQNYTQRNSQVWGVDCWTRGQHAPVKACLNLFSWAHAQFLRGGPPIQKGEKDATTEIVPWWWLHVRPFLKQCAREKEKISCVFTFVIKWGASTRVRQKWMCGGISNTCTI